MKKKLYCLLIALFILCISGTVAVNASTNTATKTIKVNKTLKIKKTLKLNNRQMKNYTFTSSKPKVASVSSKGVVKGLKKGTTIITVKNKANGTVSATVKVKVKNRYTAADLRLMSAIIYSEAGNQCYAGKKAVGIVIRNRMRSSLFPNSLSGVIYQSGQFSPAGNGSLNRSLSMYDNGQLNKECITAAKASLNGDTYVNYGGRTINMYDYYFFSGYVAGCRLQIQGHQFK